MNPFLQSAKYDPDAVYIKMYIPELKDTPVKQIHKGTWDPEVTKYTLPIVDQKAASAHTVAIWRKNA
jgi:deoxyribodipyrimidine photo-lyase